MSRLSIILLLLLSLGISAAGTYLLVFPRVSTVVQDEVRDGLKTAVRFVGQMEREDEAKLLSKMADSASRSNLLDLLDSRPGASVAKQKWLDDLRVEIAALTASLRNIATVSDMFILDAEGNGLVRNVDMHWSAKPPSDDKSVLSAVKNACEGHANEVIIATQQGLSRVVATPISDKGKQLGVLLGFFPLDTTEIRSRKSFIESDVDIVVLSDGKVKASSLEKDRLAKVEKYLADHEKILARMLSVASHPEIIDAKALDAYLAGIYLKSRTDKPAPCGLILLRWTKSHDATMNEIAAYFFTGMALLFVFLSFLIVLIGGGLMRSLKSLEHDLLDVVNSDQKRALRAGGPSIIRSIAHLCSQLISDEEIGDDDHGQEQENDDSHQMSDLDDLSGTTEGDPLSDYYASLYGEFCSAKKELGERVNKLNLDRFRAKLEKQSKRIKNKHSCKDVRFEVMVKSGKVSLQPKIVR